MVSQKNTLRLQAAHRSYVEAYKLTGDSGNRPLFYGRAQGLELAMEIVGVHFGEPIHEIAKAVADKSRISG